MGVPILCFYGDVIGCTATDRRNDIGLIHLRVGRSLIDLVPLSGKLGAAGGAAPGAKRGCPSRLVIASRSSSEKRQRTVKNRRRLVAGEMRARPRMIRGFAAGVTGPIRSGRPSDSRGVDSAGRKKDSLSGIVIDASA